MLRSTLIHFQPGSTDTGKAPGSEVDKDDVVVVTAKLSRFRIGLRRLFLRRYSLRFHLRMFREWIQARWWRLRGY